MVADHTLQRVLRLIIGRVRFKDTTPVPDHILRERQRILGRVRLDRRITKLDAGLHNHGNHPLPCVFEAVRAECLPAQFERPGQIIGFCDGGRARFYPPAPRRVM